MKIFRLNILFTDCLTFMMCLSLFTCYSRSENEQAKDYQQRDNNKHLNIVRHLSGTNDDEKIKNSNEQIKAEVPSQKSLNNSDIKSNSKSQNNLNKENNNHSDKNIAQKTKITNNDNTKLSNDKEEISNHALASKIAAETNIEIKNKEGQNLINENTSLLKNKLAKIDNTKKVIINTLKDKVDPISKQKLTKLNDKKLFELEEIVSQIKQYELEKENLKKIKNLTPIGNADKILTDEDIDKLSKTKTTQLLNYHNFIKIIMEKADYISYNFSYKDLKNMDYETVNKKFSKYNIHEIEKKKMIEFIKDFTTEYNIKTFLTLNENKLNEISFPLDFSSIDHTNIKLNFYVIKFFKWAQSLNPNIKKIDNILNHNNIMTLLAIFHIGEGRIPESFKKFSSKFKTSKQDEKLRLISVEEVIKEADTIEDPQGILKQLTEIYCIENENSNITIREVIPPTNNDNPDSIYNDETKKLQANKCSIYLDILMNLEIIKNTEEFKGKTIDEITKEIFELYKAYIPNNIYDIIDKDENFKKFKNQLRKDDNINSAERNRNIVLNHVLYLLLQKYIKYFDKNIIKELHNNFYECLPAEKGYTGSKWSDTVIYYSQIEIMTLLINSKFYWSQIINNISNNLLPDTQKEYKINLGFDPYTLNFVDFETWIRNTIEDFNLWYRLNKK